MFEDEDEGDEIPPDTELFVGRDRERETIKQLLGHSVKALQLVGPPMVGKAGLAEKVSRELQDEMDAQDKTLLCYHMSCKDVSSQTDFLVNVSACIGLGETSVSERALINSFKLIVNNNKHCTHMFVFLKCEGLEKNLFHLTFLDLVKKLMEVSKKVFCIITTQKAFSFPPARRVAIGPLSDDEIITLVRRSAPNVDVEPYKDTIVDRCKGLPPLAMDAAHELVKAQGFVLTPEDFDEMLSPENRSLRVYSEDVLNQAAVRQFEGLNDFLKQRIIDMSIFRGSFRVDDILALWDNRRGEAMNNLIEIRNSGLVELDTKGERMKLQAVTSHYIRSILGSQIKHDDTVRLRFVSLFLDVLKKADSELYIKPRDTVFGYLHNDWANLRQVLEEAIHCNIDTYPAFLKVSLSAETLLVKCFPGEAVKFYESMMIAASMFGSREECAIQKWLLGMSKTLSKGMDLAEAMGLFKEALPILRGGSRKDSLVSLLADMGLNYVRQGKNKKSRHFYLQAMEEAGRYQDGRKMTNRVINVRCYLAIPMIYLEHYDDAERLLKETLEESQRSAPYHPSVPIMINSLGLIYERSGRGDDEALRYYTASLSERRKYSDVAPGDLVVVLNNVGMQHSKRGNHDYALQLLAEARRIRMRIDKYNYHTGLTCWNMGLVFARKCEIESALLECNAALEIFEKCTKTHFAVVEVMFMVAHFKAILGDYRAAEEVFLEALQTESMYQDFIPGGRHILLLLLHLMLAHLGWKPTCSPYMDRALAEASRLADLCRSLGNMDQHLNLLQQKVALSGFRARMDQENASEEMVEEVAQNVAGYCYMCSDMILRDMDMTDVFVRMTKATCSDLKSSERLLRSDAITRAVQLLEEATSDTDSPPVSPTPSEENPMFFFDSDRKYESAKSLNTSVCYEKSCGNTWANNILRQLNPTDTTVQLYTNDQCEDNSPNNQEPKLSFDLQQPDYDGIEERESLGIDLSIMKRKGDDKFSCDRGQTLENYNNGKANVTEDATPSALHRGQSSDGCTADPLPDANRGTIQNAIHGKMEAATSDYHGPIHACCIDNRVSCPNDGIAGTSIQSRETNEAATTATHSQNRSAAPFRKTNSEHFHAKLEHALATIKKSLGVLPLEPCESGPVDMANPLPNTTGGGSVSNNQSDVSRMRIPLENDDRCMCSSVENCHCSLSVLPDKRDM